MRNAQGFNCLRFGNSIILAYKENKSETSDSQFITHHCSHIKIYMWYTTRVTLLVASGLLGIISQSIAVSLGVYAKTHFQS
jgi:hypothetical protein